MTSEHGGTVGVDDVAAAFVAALGPMPATKLEKLLYYAQAWSVAAHGRSLFDDDIEAWVEGPVIDKIYQQHKGSWMVHSWPAGDPQGLSAHARRVVTDIVHRYGELSGDALSELTHQESPWRDTRAGLAPDARSRRVIPLDMMARYYGGQLLRGDDAVRHAAANAAMEGLSVPEDWLITLIEVADGRRDADDVAAHLTARYSRQA